MCGPNMGQVRLLPNARYKHEEMKIRSVGVNEGMTDDDPDRLLPSVHLDELDVEDERGVGRDGAGDALGAVAHVGADGQLGALPDRHLAQALVPPLDHLQCQQTG